MAEVRKFWLIVFHLLTIFLLFILNCEAQNNSESRHAFIRSLVVPGWGHYYVDSENWDRGRAHLAAEIVLIASYFGISARAENLEHQYETLASLKAGVDITERSRAFRLALGDFESLQEYNDFQLRSRNWNRLYSEVPENEWNWQQTDDRNRYNSLRSDVDRVRNQLPAILGLMVVNRVVSAISSYNRAKKPSGTLEISLLPGGEIPGEIGAVGRMKIRF